MVCSFCCMLNQCLEESILNFLEWLKTLIVNEWSDCLQLMIECTKDVLILKAPVRHHLKELLWRKVKDTNTVFVVYISSCLLLRFDFLLLCKHKKKVNLGNKYSKIIGINIGIIQQVWIIIGFSSVLLVCIYKPEGWVCNTKRMKFNELFVTCR